MNIKKLRFCLLPLIASVLAACDSGSGGQPNLVCAETGAYACQTGETEPLYTFQWALNYAASYFKDFPDVFGGGLDLNVEPVHRMGIKGQGINVLVLDTGTDLHNEDLAPNADYSMSWNFVTQQDDPYPDLNANSPAHGTVVAGIIAAAQNGKGVMGIAPRATIGGANYLSGQSQVFAAYGGAPWSSKADVFNASFGGDTAATSYESDIDNDTTTALRGIKNLRQGKGAIFVKAAGNSFNPGLCGWQAAYFDCTNPANDVSVLESNVITVAALNAKGSASSYSSAGSVVWVTGLGGEYGGAGNYGEGSENGDGPTIFSTDLRGCIYGFSYTGAETPFLRGQTVRNGRPDNPDCDYTYMNGTSAATPTIAGVVALVLDANPELTWRDVRDILRMSARKVDADYIHHIPRKGDKPYGALEDLATNQPTSQLGSAADIRDGSTAFPMDLGWQKNAAGYEYSNWYGFGVPDTEKAVELARQYKNDPSLSRAQDVQIPNFSEVAYWQLNPLTGTESSDHAGVQIRLGEFPYQRITSLGTFKADAQTVDQLQVRLSGEDVCLGSLGIAAKSPSGTVSLLKLPNDHFKANGINRFHAYTLGSFAFYGEQAKGDWELFAIASNPDTQIEVIEIIDNQRRIRLSTVCPSTDGSGGPIDFKLLTEARIIAQ